MIKPYKESFLHFIEHQLNVGRDLKDALLLEEQITKKPLEYIALDTGLVSEDQLLNFFAEYRQCPVADLASHSHTITSLIQTMPFKELEQNIVLPFKCDEKRKVITFAMFDVSDIHRRERIESLLPEGYTMDLAIAKKSDIQDILAHHAPPIDPLSKKQHAIGNQVISEFLYHIFVQSIQKNASDIHFEPESFFVRIRIRCDGVLVTLKQVHKSLWQELNIQIKVLADMDIAESRHAQDGRFDVHILGKMMNFRVSSHPTHHGESIVLRALDNNTPLKALNCLGYSDYTMTVILSMLRKPDGLIVMTGPTGSGKSTSLYSMVSYFDKNSNKIMTLEEPVEYKIPGICQTEINKTFSFYDGIHSILRQDPDIILVGEIRDEKVASTIVRASMTGHTVLSTLHTIRALDVIDRLVELNTPLSMVVSIVNGVVNQRLVRLLCPQCKRLDAPSAQDQKTFNIPDGQSVARPVGCEQCLFSGYSGRTVIAEAMCIDDDLGGAILQKKGRPCLYDLLYAKGFQTLEDEARRLVMNHTTSCDEIYRVLGG